MDLGKVSCVRCGQDFWIFVLLMAVGISSSNVTADPDFHADEGQTEEEHIIEPEEEDPHRGARNYYIWTGVMLGILFLTVLICFIASLIYNHVNKRRQRAAGNGASQVMNIPKVFVMHPPSYISQDPPPYSAPDYRKEDSMKQIQQNKHQFKRTKTTQRDIRFQHLQLTNPAFTPPVCNSVHQVTTDCIHTLGIGNRSNNCLCYNQTSGINLDTEESPPPYRPPQLQTILIFDSDYNQAATSSTTNAYNGVNSRPMLNRDSQSNTEHSGGQGEIAGGEEQHHHDISGAAVNTPEQDIVITNLNRPINQCRYVAANSVVGMELTQL